MSSRANSTSPGTFVVPAAPDWSVDGDEWPHREASLFVDVGGFTWHVQRFGARGANRPTALLIHGTGAATHSWAGLAPLLAETHEVVAFDLPSHGFTRAPRGAVLSLPSIAAAVADLASALGVKPDLIIGHSAGAAIMIHLTLDGAMRPSQLISVNGALAPFNGPAAFLFPMMAKALHYNPIAAYLFAKSAAERARVERLIRQTGSEVDAAYVDAYARVMRTTRHISGALGMMANWDLTDMPRALRRLTTPTLFLAGENDRAVPPVVARRAAAAAPGGVHVSLEGLGHLAHEEAPARILQALGPAPGAADGR